jgi:formylglycine-generating enzyme required for sulfatase activity
MPGMTLMTAPPRTGRDGFKAIQTAGRSRGGSWRNDASVVRAAIRDKRNIHVRFDTLGFGVAGTLSP